MTTRVANRGSLVAQLVKNLPAMQEIWVRSLGQEDPLEKGMTTHSSILGMSSLSKMNTQKGEVFWRHESKLHKM